MLQSILPRRVRLAVATLWVIGIGLAGFTAPLAWRRTGVVTALPFIFVVVAGVRLTIGVLRVERWALVISVLLLGAQIGGVVGSAWELTVGVRGAKARQLRRLGVEPVFGVALNLAYSAVAFGAFAWIAARWRAARRRTDAVSSPERRRGPNQPKK